MKAKLIYFTDKQIEYLSSIKNEHEISSSAYIRQLLRDDMDGRSSSVGISFDASGRTINRYVPRTVKDRVLKVKKDKERKSSKQTDMLKELKSVLASRREIVDSSQTSEISISCQ